MHAGEMNSDEESIDWHLCSHASPSPWRNGVYIKQMCPKQWQPLLDFCIIMLQFHFMCFTRLPFSCVSLALLLDSVMCLHFLCISPEYIQLWMLREGCPVLLASQKMFPERTRSSLVKPQLSDQCLWNGAVSSALGILITQGCWVHSNYLSLP